MKKESQDKNFCPIARVAELLGDSCTLLIVRDLLTGTKRFKDFEQSLLHVSSRTIAKKLKMLEEKNIITRTAFKERPPKVEYQLTKEGNHLNILINDMSEYGKKFL